ncbi:MAG: ATP-binding cassette domain-containing protein, partial [Gemmatimonadota bacterium]|nr:ATP-binding cassette domain-containing protein [Gemmatimonadota bacterium]
QEADDLLRVVRRFTERGGAAVLITHKLREALAAADYVTVLRRGQVVLAGAARDQSAERLASAMLGAEAAAPGRTAMPLISDAAAPLVTLRGVSVTREGGPAALTDAELSVAAGEIVGVAAVEGNGQRELLRCIAGLVAPAQGTLAVAQPVAHIPEDRTIEGLIPPLSLTGNFVLGTFGRLPFTQGMRIDWPEARRRTVAMIDSADVRAPSPEVPAEALSGGNQQKFVVARALEVEPRVVVAENPTRGLDLHAAAAVHGALREAAARGAAVLVHSSDLDEVLELATRVVVVANGRVVTPPVGASRDAIGRLMLGAPA